MSLASTTGVSSPTGSGDFLTTVSSTTVFLSLCVNLTNMCKNESDIIGNIPPAKNAKNLL